MLWRGRNAPTFGRGTPCSLAIILPCGVGALQAGVFWLLGEEILHKERRDFVRRQNRGVRKICRMKKTKVSRPYSFIRAERVVGAWAHREFEGFGSGCGQRHQSLCECAVGIRWSSSVAFVERHRGRVPLFININAQLRMSMGIVYIATQPK